MFFPGESHGQRSLAAYCPWDRKESELAEVTCHGVSIWLLFGVFNSSPFQVIIGMFIFITIFLIVLGLFMQIFCVCVLCFLPREVPLAFVVKLVW